MKLLDFRKDTLSDSVRTAIQHWTKKFPEGTLDDLRTYLVRIFPSLSPEEYMYIGEISRSN